MLTPGFTMFFNALIAATVLVASIVSAQPACGTYTIISTRGTTERQGPSSSFTTMIANTLRQAPGGATYNTVYPANVLQQSESGTVDIINRIRSTLATCPNHKFALLGYSQGAAATVEALERITDTATFNAIKVVILTGNPRHVAGRQSNFDTNGSKSTANANGLQAFLGGIPTPRWDRSGKVLDICARGDGVCDAAALFDTNIAHLTYPNSQWTQTAGTTRMVNAFTT